MRLSQGHLNLLTTCPRKFQYTFLEQLAAPPTPEQQEKLNWGNRFHLLMQQRELGLPIESIVAEDPQLQIWFNSFISAAPEILIAVTDSTSFREAEHSRTLKFQDYLLTVIYDLLIADQEQAQILDWKTYARPNQRQWIEKNWQTRLYCYALVATSNYFPEQVSLTYWFVQSEKERESPSLKFSYDSRQHQQIHEDLTDLLNQLTVWLQEYEQGEFFPQIPETAGHCQNCTFAIRCHRQSESEEDAIASWTYFSSPTRNELSDLANIEEVSLI